MKTYRFKLYNSKKNRHLHYQISLAGEIYNHCIALHRRYYRLYKKSLNVYALQKHITKLKKLDKYSHWNELGSQAIQDVANRIDKAYKLFYHNHKAGIKSAPPGFKKRQKYTSFTLKQCGYKLLDSNGIRIGNKVYKYFKSREIEGNIKTLTIKRDPLGDIYLCFAVDTFDTQVQFRTGAIVGFDFGLKTFLTASDGNDVESPLFFRMLHSEVGQANRNLSRKRKGSNNRQKARLNLARIHKKLANRRSDFHFKLANQLTDEYDVLIFETLNIKAMQRLWGKKIGDLGFSDFIKIVQYYAESKGKSVIFIDRWEPTTKMCSVCGYINKNLSLKDRTWICPDCKTHHGRDHNASVNILRVGASTLGLGDVRPTELAITV